MPTVHVLLVLGEGHSSTVPKGVETGQAVTALHANVGEAVLLPDYQEDEGQAPEHRRRRLACGIRTPLGTQLGTGVGG